MADEKTDSRKEGWITLSRKFLNSKEWLSEPFTKAQAWVDLIGLASFDKGFIIVRGTPIKLKRGEVGYSQESLAKRWKWSRGKAKRFLNYLEIEHRIEQVNEQVNKYVKTVISITNYDHYQNGGQVKGQEGEHQTNIRRTSDDTVYKNEKNENNEKQLLKAESWKKFFTEWWEIYPMRDGKKIGKAKALKILLGISDKHYEDIYNATLNYAKDKTVNNYGIKDPERFLKNGYYKEWLKTPIAAKAKPRGVITDSYGNFISYASNAGY